MNQAFRLIERTDVRARCSLCHDSSGALVACDACRSLFHAECRAGLGRCATLGCSEQGLTIRPSSDERATHGPSFLLAVGLSALSALSIELLVVSFHSAGSWLVDTGKLGEQAAFWAAVVGVVLAYLAHVVVLPLTLAARWGRENRFGVLLPCAVFQVCVAPFLLLCAAVIERKLWGVPVTTLALLVLEPPLAAWAFGRSKTENAAPAPRAGP